MDTVKQDDNGLAQRAAVYIADLRNEYSYVREEAFEMLKGIGPDPILDQLLEANKWAINDCNATWLFRRVLVSLAIGVGGFLVFSSLASCERNWSWSAGAFLFGGFCTFLSCVFSYALKPASASEFRQQSVLRLLCSSEDPRSAGALCDYLQSPMLRKRDVGLNKSVLNALTRLLPRVRSDALETLTSRQRATLRLELRRITWDYSHETDADPERENSLAIAILQSIESFGDIAAIADVEWFYERSAGLTDGHELTEQAQQCLSVLRELQDAERQGKALLRSSENPSGATELLRQAKSPEANLDELLRPENEDDEPT